MYCVPATSAPVERIFSHGDIFMRLHRARMTVDVHQKCEHFGLGFGLGLGLESYGLGLVLVLPLLVLTTSLSSTNVEMDKRATSCNQFIAIHKMSAFANYIECTCIDGDFLPSLWTHYGNPGPRTTNPTEGWHNALNCTFSMRRPSLRTFLHYVKKCQFEVQTCIIQLKAAQPPKSKSENYIKLEQNLTAAKLDYGTAIAKSFSCIFPHPSAYAVRSLTMTLQAGDADLQILQRIYKMRMLLRIKNPHFTHTHNFKPNIIAVVNWYICVVLLYVNADACLRSKNTLFLSFSYRRNFVCDGDDHYVTTTTFESGSDCHHHF